MVGAGGMASAGVVRSFRFQVSGWENPCLSVLSVSSVVHSPRSSLLSPHTVTPFERLERIALAEQTYCGLSAQNLLPVVAW